MMRNSSSGGLLIGAVPLAKQSSPSPGGTADTTGHQQRRAVREAPLVSILIPAYNSRFFEETVKSALGQTYGNIELIICDDSPAQDIKGSVEKLHDSRLRYVKNPVNLGFAGNFTRCFQLAVGEYIKFLNDDDVLSPNCIATMVEKFQEYGDGLTLVTSRRRIINEHGHFMEDIFATTPLAVVESHMKGVDLANHVLKHSTNFIGEPTTAMFRKRDLNVAAASVFNMNGHEYHCLADLSLWLRLLGKGDAVYVPDSLSFFRRHSNQEQDKPATAIKCITERFYLIEDSRKLGFLQDKDLHIASLTTTIRIFENFLSASRLPEEVSTEIRRLLSLMIRDLTLLGSH